MRWQALDFRIYEGLLLLERDLINWLRNLRTITARPLAAITPSVLLPYIAGFAQSGASQPVIE